MSRLAFLTFLIISYVLYFASSCEQGPPESPLAARGRAVFFSKCNACHNADPSRAGAVGPAIKGSSVELITARVRHQTYPENYKPLRETKIMPVIDVSDDDIKALAEFIK